MGKKADRIASLEAENATLRRELSAAQGIVHTLNDRLKTLTIPAAPSLLGRARETVLDLGDRLAEWAGLR